MAAKTHFLFRFLALDGPKKGSARRWCFDTSKQFYIFENAVKESFEADEVRLEYIASEKRRTTITSQKEFDECVRIKASEKEIVIYVKTTSNSEKDSPEKDELASILDDPLLDEMIIKNDPLFLEDDPVEELFPFQMCGTKGVMRFDRTEDIDKTREKKPRKPLDDEVMKMIHSI